jgi:hypothetical protein
MTKDECIEVVERIYASWNQQVSPMQKKLVYRSWWRILGDLDNQIVHEIIDALVIEAGYMPRPGEIRRRTINRIHGIRIPSAMEAWQQFREAADASASGSYEGRGVHEMVAVTVKALGGTRAYSLHTNGDREQFIHEYTNKVSEYEATLYGVESQEWTPLGSPNSN